MLNIKKAVVLIENFGSDKIFLKTDLPSAIWPYNGTAGLSMDVAAGLGLAYCKKYFPDVELEIVSRTRGLVSEADCCVNTAQLEKVLAGDNDS